MRFIHISDIHIGKKVNEFSMLDDQVFVLKQVIDTALKQEADAVIIAGDIYDKSVPPAEAVEVFDWFITELSQKGIKIYAVSGNHDSPQRIAFGSGIMSKSGVYFSGVYNGKVEKYVFEDKYGKVNIYLLPFIKPANVKRYYEDKEITDYNSALKTVLENTPINENDRNVIVAHQFVTGAQRSDSEEISVGGIDNVDASLFKTFDYTALGHIHGPQSMGKNIIYSGSPLKYSFSEINQKKAMVIVDLNEKGSVVINKIPFVPLHDMREVKGYYDQITSRANYINTKTDDYIKIVLKDDDEIIDAIGKLRSIYPNIMNIDYDNTRAKTNSEAFVNNVNTNKSPTELFCELFEIQNNMPVSSEQLKEINRVFESVEEELVWDR